MSTRSFASLTDGPFGYNRSTVRMGGNQERRLAEICGEGIRRLYHGGPKTFGAGGPGQIRYCSGADSVTIESAWRYSTARARTLVGNQSRY